LELSEYKDTFAAIAAAAPEEEEGETVIHGDFWCGNILPCRRSGGAGVAMVIDWEMCRLGHAWQDLAQMCAELFLPFQFRGVEEGLEIISAFLKSYGAVDKETASRVVVHFGVHLVVWPPRIPGWGEREEVERCVRTGAEFIEKGRRRDWEWVKRSVLAKIVDDQWIVGLNNL
jgi:hypothetical protein